MRLHVGTALPFSECAITIAASIPTPSVASARAVPKASPIEFRNSLVVVAGEGEGLTAQVAKDVGVCESCRQRWLKLADIEGGSLPGHGQ